MRSTPEPLKTKGRIAAAFTPVEKNSGLPDISRISPLVDFLKQQGVAGLYVLGSTGEGPSFSTEERMEVMEAFTRAADGNLPVILNIGHDSCTDACALARRAQELGAAAVSAPPPVFFRPDSLESLAGFFARVSEAAPRLPFYYYHIPQRTGVEVKIPDFIKALEERVPTLAGIKFSAMDLPEFHYCLETFGDRYDFFWGSDVTYLSAKAVGATAFIGSSYNFATRLYAEIDRCVDSGDLKEAQALQQMVTVALMKLLTQGMDGLKRVMGFCGMDVGPVRLPLLPADGEAMESILNSLEASGITRYLGIDADPSD